MTRPHEEDLEWVEMNNRICAGNKTIVKHHY